MSALIAVFQVGDRIASMRVLMPFSAFGIWPHQSNEIAPSLFLGCT